MYWRVSQLRYTRRMKTATIPSVRVEPDFRAEVEAVLADGETLSEFVEENKNLKANMKRILDWSDGSEGDVENLMRIHKLAGEKP